MHRKRTDTANSPLLIIALGKPRVGKTALLNTNAEFRKPEASNRKRNGDQLKKRGEDK